MSAGKSAYDVARRQREKAARLERSAVKWEQGADGEVAVAKALGALPAGWVVLHDLAWPGRPKANIDHVAIGPGGVFVIDAKNWTGSVEVRDQVLRQNGRAREQAVISAAEAAIALQQVVSGSQLVMGVLCFVRDDPMSGWARDVMVCTTTNLVAMLSSRPAVLEADEIERYARDVRRATPIRSTARPAPPRRPATPANRSRPRRGRQPRTSWARLVVALAFLALLLGGGLTKVSEWASDRLVDQAVPTQPAGPGEKPRPGTQGGTAKDRSSRDADRQK